MECFNISSLLAVTLNRPEEELSELLTEKSEEGEVTLKDDAYDIAVGLIKDKVQGIKSDEEIKRKKAVEKAQSEAYKDGLSKLETSIREKYGIESDSLGIDLVDEAVNKFKVDSSELKPDKIKLSDTYLAREKELTNQLKEVENTYKKQIEEMQKGWENEKVLSVVKKDIKNFVLGLKPVLPKNPKVAENVVDTFIETRFGKYGWQLSDDGNHIPLDGEGSRVEDKLGNALQFGPLVESESREYFEFYVQNPKGSPGNEPGGGGTDDVPQTFENEDAYNKYIDSVWSDPAKRTKAYENWKAQ